MEHHNDKRIDPNRMIRLHDVLISASLISVLIALIFLMDLSVYFSS